MTAPPAGTLTFLFADLRDYTAFVEQHGDEAAASLIANYRRLVRSEVARHAGAEIKTEGDSFYIVFSSARQALQCATAILRQAHRRSRQKRPLRVGIGLHAGEPVPHEGQYVGSAVNVAARLGAAAAAGELLVSEVVRGLLRTSGMPPTSERRDLVLKGVAEAPRVFAVEWRSKPSIPVPTEASREVAVAAEPPPDRRILCPELIGRELELGQLEALLRDAQRGIGRTVLLAGEAGLGKSAVLRAFAERARGSGTRILLGECTEVEARRPFGPFLEIARAALRELSPGGGQTAGGTELRALLPELGRAAAGTEPAGEEQRYRAHESITRLLSEVAERSPVVVAVEDLHWADEASLELFPYLARKLQRRPVLLLGTYRSDELHRTHPLRRVLVELARGRLAEELRLHRLSLEEVGTLLRAAMRLNREPTPAWRQAMHERCEGNPFFIEEVLKALVERGDLAYREGMWRRTKQVPEIALPDSIRDALLERLGRLSAEDHRALQVAAVIGQRFGFELLRRVSGLSEETLLVALRATVEAQLVEEVPDSGSDEIYAFRHALTRESVLAELLQRERRLLHKAVGEAIEASAADQPADAEALAYHFDQARDQERAYRYHQLAAAEATRLFAFARAVGHLERALDLAPDDDPALADLQFQLARAAASAADPSRAARAAEESRRMFEARGDIRRLGGTMLLLSDCRWQLGETREAQALVGRAVELLEPLGESVELAYAYAWTAGLAQLARRSDDAIDLGKKAISVARAAKAVDAEALGLNWVGTAMVLQDRHEGLNFLHQSIELALRHELVVEALRGYNNLEVALLSLGAPLAERRGVHEESVRHARRFGLRFQPLLTSQCQYAATDGEWDHLLAVVDENRDESIWSAVREMLAAVVEGARQGPEQGLALAKPPRARLLGAGDAQWVAIAMRWSAYLHLLAGGDQDVIVEAERAMALVTQGDVRLALPLALLCGLLAARSDVARSERWMALASAAGAPARSRGVDGLARFAAGLRARRDGDGETALAALAESAELFEDAMERGFASTLVRLERADLLVDRGEREAATAELARLLPFWRKAKATWYLGKLREWAEVRRLALPGE